MACEGEHNQRRPVLIGPTRRPGGGVPAPKSRVMIANRHRRWLVVALLVAISAVSCTAPAGAPAPVMPGEWRDFEGSWTSAGKRHAIPMGDGRRCSSIDLTGTMLLSGANRPGVGFRSDVVALVDSLTGLTGRAVWTDERGDQVFSELTGQGTAANNRVEGTIVGGTGRYAGIEGSYAFAWQYVIESEEGQIEGRAVGLTGRYRIAEHTQEKTP